MPKTTDGCTVGKRERVYEIMWEWLNPEVSIAYPQATILRDVPEGVKIWRNRDKCRLVCNKLNKKVNGNY